MEDKPKNTITEEWARSSYAITTHPQSDKTELTIWENGTATTIELDRVSLSVMVGHLKNLADSELSLHTISKIYQGILKLSHGCYAIQNALSTEGKENAFVSNKINRIREDVKAIENSLAL
ncbi:hypothetical protein [Desulfotignum phosphitoxidans]|uniref:Uncharacterized protein n=1 Tax=Desulfotignum phosphitoxidans DSM 13687 TaxID=1286635 RepID=S0G166_9BACT|nr:hypothetical protein [Desulfotignum phosphitoxidans]EMS79174.1 hypothetical protein Dpo_5c00970 [Desulfotignum phosphitoxidans DSM 13687]